MTDEQEIRTVIGRLLKVIEAQDKLLVAYRIGGRPPVSALDTPTRKDRAIEAPRELVAPKEDKRGDQ